MTRSRKIVWLCMLAALLVFVTWKLEPWRLLIAPVGPPEITLSDLHKSPEPIPGEPPRIVFSQQNMNSAKRQEFLAGDYKIARRMRELPPGIVKDFTVEGGTKLAIADPGEKFEATDVIEDPDLPRRRLIFAGVNNDRVFVHYEMGGIAHSFVLDFFDLRSSQDVVALWEGFCDEPASDLDDLRSRIEKGTCYGLSERLRQK